jgi:hypothetical protein
MRITPEFLQILDNSLIQSAKWLGIESGLAQGGVAEDVEERTMDLHGALVEQHRALEALHNWAHEVSRALRESGHDVPVSSD